MALVRLMYIHPINCHSRYNMSHMYCTSAPRSKFLSLLRLIANLIQVRNHLQICVSILSFKFDCHMEHLKFGQRRFITVEPVLLVVF